MGGENIIDGVSSRPATTDALNTFSRAGQQLNNFSAPVLYDSSDPSSRVFVALMDGTRNSAYNDSPNNQTMTFYKVTTTCCHIFEFLCVSPSPRETITVFPHYNA